MKNTETMTNIHNILLHSIQSMSTNVDKILQETSPMYEIRYSKYDAVPPGRNQQDNNWNVHRV